MKPKKHFPGSGKFDKINSTYKHVIHLTEKNKVKSLEGYSKGLLQKEQPDKIVLLESIIVRLFNKGYLDPERVLRIEFFYKDFLGGKDELALTVEPLTYSLHNDKLILNTRLNSFLQKFYNQIRSGKIVTKDIVSSRIIKMEEDIFDLKRKRFQDEMELLEFVINKTKEGFPEGRTKQFFYKYKEKWLTTVRQTA